MKTKELIKNVPSSEKVLEWNAKETTTGSEQKANDAFERAKSYADQYKVRKEEGKGLSSEDFTKAEKDKLATLENYTHPEKHTTDDITTNSNARFVSEAQIAEWDKKETVDGAQGKANKALADSKAYTDEETTRLDNSKIDHVELQTKELLFKANQMEKFRITLPDALSSIPIASDSQLGGIKVGAGLSISVDGTLSASIGGVADSVQWENVVGKPERFPAMEHIHDAATSDKDGFMAKTDKVKLDSLTNYTHPDSHPASMITEDASHKFVTDEQITSFNDKYTKVETNNLLKRKFDNVDLSGNTLRFYADSVKKFDIELPTGISNLPIASKDILGGIKVGTDFSITDDGTLSLASSTTHAHSNLDTLNKINDSKVTEWDGKASKEYVDNKLLKTKRLVINIFEHDSESGFYKANAVHGLNTESVFIMAFDSTTKESEILSYKIIDKNTIEVATTSQVDSIDLYIIGGEFMTSVENVIINDSATTLESTWSSQKINTELQKYSSLPTQVTTLSEKVTQVESSTSALPGQITSVSEKLDGVDLEVKSMKEATNKIATIESNIEQQNTQNQSTFSLLRADVDKKVATEDLSRSGGCQINGENIQTGTLSVDLIKSNNENPIVKLFDRCAIDATASMNQGKGDSLRLKWDDSNYIKISASDIAFYNNGKATLRVREESNPVISFYGGASIDATSSGSTEIRLRADNNNYMRVSASGEARFYINGSTAVRINSSGIVQGVPAQANVLPATLTKGPQTQFSEFVANEFGNAIVLDQNNKLAIDTTKITTPEMKEMLTEEDGSYSYSGCIAILTMALKEEIEARKNLEASINK